MWLSHCGDSLIVHHVGTWAEAHIIRAAATGGWGAVDYIRWRKILTY